MIQFGTLRDDGTYTPTDKIPQSRFLQCPNTIIDPGPLVGDTFKCYDKDAPEMVEWGYTWDDTNGVWT